MTRWFVGVRIDGRREVFAETGGNDPIASAMGFDEVCGPYRSESDASKAARAKPTVQRASNRAGKAARPGLGPVPGAGAGTQPGTPPAAPN